MGGRRKLALVLSAESSSSSLHLSPVSWELAASVADWWLVGGSQRSAPWHDDLEDETSICAGGGARAQDAARRDGGSSSTTGQLRRISCARGRGFVAGRSDTYQVTYQIFRKLNKKIGYSHDTYRSRISSVSVSMLHMASGSFAITTGQQCSPKISTDKPAPVSTTHNTVQRPSA